MKSKTFGDQPRPMSYESLDFSLLCVSVSLWFFCCLDRPSRRRLVHCGQTIGPLATGNRAAGPDYCGRTLIRPIEW